MVLKNWKKYPIYISGILFLLIPALYNHYPLVNPDTAVYIESGFLPEMPSDRPITYGLLIRLFSLNGLSLWLVVVAQALLVFWLIGRLVGQLGNGQHKEWKALLIVAILSTCTGLSWVVSQVQPDFFTGIGLLSLMVIITCGERKNVLLYVVFFISVAAHLSHPVLFSALVFVIGLAHGVYSGRQVMRPWRKLLTLLALSVSGIIVMLTPLHKSKHIFFMGSLLEKGVLKTYLDDNCSTGNFLLCKYKDSLPADVNYFWWDSNSPLYKIGDWKSVKPEFDAIFHGVFTSPKYLKLYLTAGARQTVTQTRTFNIGDGNQQFGDGTYVSKTILRYFPQEAGIFKSAVQNNDQMLAVVEPVNKFFSWFLVVSCLCLLLIVSRWKSIALHVRLVIFIALAGLLLNNADCALFGIVNGRYGCKVAWLVPFAAMVYLVSPRTKSAPFDSDKEITTH